ncbi:uncharacterized protein LOC134552536 isoform X2 [Prinia subflava]|uniref:uncharacterized protein LOC134552536 isoform X2 n=1 Tax=Prinia subflava TaxID=208062 RepID=UPI002FE3D299
MCSPRRGRQRPVSHSTRRLPPAEEFAKTSFLHPRQVWLHLSKSLHLRDRAWHQVTLNPKELKDWPLARGVCFIGPAHPD